MDDAVRRRDLADRPVAPVALASLHLERTADADEADVVRAPEPDALVEPGTLQQHVVHDEVQAVLGQCSDRPVHPGHEALAERPGLDRERAIRPALG
jgi:hypothetical protein